MNMNFTMIILGITIGIAAAFFLLWFKKKSGNDACQERSKELETIVENLKGTFAALSLEALSKNSEEFLKLAGEKLNAAKELGENDLENKKKLIDQTFSEMKSELSKVEEIMRSLEKDRENKFAQLSTNLDVMRQEASRLQQTTDQLRNALSSSKARGQWGERMAEDVLRLAGFIEGVNYVKQKAQGSGRPDYTFFLPQGLCVNMDVKFPLDNYWRYFEAKSDPEKEGFRSQFLKDVKERIKEVTSRDYIDLEQKTVDYVIVFIPNEQVYAFVNESDRSILDDAMRQKVIFCSPLTLYAILAVIRQAMDNFSLERTAHKMLSVLASFEKQYQAFCASLEKMGEKLDDAKKEYDSLITTRKNQLDRQLKKLEEIRTEKAPALEDKSVL
ncbi:MAG TPA: DNA recombination protein RmuC [Candidatus Omnitrophota bacterium]|nr:DNA recombination protein RmuC [Candidatus Omnitrophota bacterium]